MGLPPPIFRQTVPRRDPRDIQARKDFRETCSHLNYHAHTHCCAEALYFLVRAQRQLTGTRLNQINARLLRIEKIVGVLAKSR